MFGSLNHRGRWLRHSPSNNVRQLTPNHRPYALRPCARQPRGLTFQVSLATTMLANARSSFYERGLAARTCVLSALSHCFEIPRRPAAARISFVSDTTLEFRLRVACVTSKLRVTLRTRHYKGQQQEKQLNKRTTVAVARAEVCQPRNRSHLRSQGTQPCLRERLSG